MGLRIGMVTVDCANPRRLADFWAAALETKVAVDYAGDAGEFVMLEPVAGQDVRMAFQKVPEPRTGKNRLHVDLEAADRVHEVARLVELGATLEYEQIGVVPGFDWSTLADPEGNLFCVSEAH